MPRENRGGGEPINGGEVDFDAVLAGVIEEKGDVAKQEVVKAETRKKSKSRRAEIAGELGGHLEGLTTKGGVESEQELVATAFNTLVYSEYHNKKVPEAVQTKLDAYNQARKKHAEATKKMANLPDDLQGDSRLQTALDKLKSDMVAQAKALAGELGVKYEEIAKGETALLATEDVEITRLREEAEKLSPGKVEYAKEKYEDYKERIAAVLKERMAERMKEIAEDALEERKLKKLEFISGQHERQLVFSDKVDDKTRENIEIDEETLKRSVALLTQEELKKVFDAIEASEPDETKRRAAIDRLSRSFGRIIDDGSSVFDRAGGGRVVLHPGSVEESAQPTPSWLIDAACAENRISFFMQSIDAAGKSNRQEYRNPLRWQILNFLRTFKEKPEGFTSESYRNYSIVRNEKISTDRSDDERDSDLTDLALKMTQVMGKLRVAYNFVYSFGEMDDTQNNSVIFREMGRIKKGRRSITPEERKESDHWNHALDVALNKHEPTNQDIVDKATKPDGTVKLDTPKRQEAMITVLQEKLQVALELAAMKEQGLREVQTGVSQTGRQLEVEKHARADLQERVKGLETDLATQSRDFVRQIKEKDQLAERWKKDGQNTANQLRAAREAIALVKAQLEVDKTTGLPALGGAKEIKRIDGIIESLERTLAGMIN